MKKITMIAMLLILTAGLSWAQSKDFNDICQRYKSLEGVETFKMRGFGCFIASLFVGGEESSVGTLVRSCSSCQLLVCDGTGSKQLYKDIKSYLHTNNLEELMNIKERGEQVKIYVKEQSGIIRQLFLAVMDGQEMVFLLLKGKFSQELLQEVMENVEIES